MVGREAIRALNFVVQDTLLASAPKFGVSRLAFSRANHRALSPNFEAQTITSMAGNAGYKIYEEKRLSMFYLYNSITSESQASRALSAPITSTSFWVSDYN